LIIKPIADLIAYLERQITNLANIYLQFIQLHLHYRNVVTGKIKSNIIDTAIMNLSNRFKQYFFHPIYPISLFLWPQYRNFAVSRHFTFESLQRHILEIAISWKFTMDECRSISHGLNDYSKHAFTQVQLDLTPSTFWKCTQIVQAPLRKFADFVFKLKGHGAPVETLFSSLSYTKTKTRNRITPSNLKTIAVVRSHLKRHMPPSQNIKARRKRPGNDGIIDISGENEDDVVLEASTDVDETEYFDFVKEFEEILLENDVEDFGFTALLKSECEVLFDLSVLEKVTENNNTTEKVSDCNNETCEEEKMFTVDDILKV
jgi:hypothetical protein